jgi:transcriptional regulator with XRE-family HTH domain
MHPPLTFDHLRSLMAEKVRDEGRSESVLHNLNSALSAFLDQQRLSGSALVGSELRVAYYRCLRTHAESLQADGRSSSYLSNRKSLLKAWKSMVASEDRRRAMEAGKSTPFQDALKELIEKGGSQRNLAKEAGVSLASLKRWLAGVAPNQVGLRAITRLERFFGLRRGQISELISGALAESDAVAPPKRNIAYRERLKDQCQDPYCLTDVGAQLRAQWLEFVVYKTSRRPRGLQRFPGAQWKTSQAATGGERIPWYAELDGAVVPTAQVNWGYLRSFFGWLQLEAGRGGCGMHADVAQTLAHLSDGALVEDYIDWRIKRSGHIIHEGVLGVLKLVRALSNPKWGYLTQRYDLAATLPNKPCQDSWTRKCGDCYSVAKDLCFTLGQQLEHSRDPFEPIASVLALANPLEAIADMTFRMRADRPLTGGLLEAVWGRDIAFVKTLASNPLRIRNLRELTWNEDNSGQLYRQPDGAWYIRLPRSAFKNSKGAARDRDYDNPVHERVWQDLERYLHCYRPQLLGGRKSAYVFISGEKPSGEDSGGAIAPWMGLDRRFFELTARYLTGCPGVGPHAMRYIVGTSILKASPNDWSTAALYLHDKASTVEKHYAHLKSSDGAIRGHTLMASAFQRM